MTDAIRETARAKVNLRLRVLGREASGFHALETLFLRLELADEVELRPGGDGIRITVELEGPIGQHEADRDLAGDATEPPDGDDPDATAARVPEGPENLCWRAAAAYYEAVGSEPAVEIRLEKRIPAGAGLGGGSADAAAVLRGLNRHHDGALARQRLAALAGELGSDVPFALADVPMALGWERGRRLLPLAAPPARPVLLVVPRLRVATPDAYRWLDEDRAAAADDAAGILPPPEELATWDSLLSLAANDFEQPVFVRHPELAWWKEELLGEGADAAHLCGSGSALFGVFTTAEKRDAAAGRFREAGEVAVLETRGPV